MQVRDRFEDRLEVLGIGAGAFLVLVGLGTIAGTPWTVKGDLLASILQIVGVLGMMAIGVGLIYLSWTGKE